MHGRSAPPWIFFLVFGISRALLGFNLILEPGLAQFEDDFLLSSREWAETGRLYPNWGPVLPGLLRLLLGLGLNDDTLLRLVVVALWQLAVLGIIASLYQSIRQVLGPRTAGLTALLLTLDPSFATPTFHVATEVPYLVLLWSGAMCWLRMLGFCGPRVEEAPEEHSEQQPGRGGRLPLDGPFTRDSFKWSILSGLLLGLSALTRGNGMLVLGGLVVLTLGVGLWHRYVAVLPSGGKRLLWQAGLMGCAGGLLIGAWSAKNLMDYGHFAPTSSGDHNIAALWIGPARARSEGRPPAANLQIWADRMPMDGWSDPFARAAKAKSVALEWAQSHPGAVVQAFVYGQLNTLLGPGKSLLARFSPLPTLPLVLWTLALRGLIIGWLVVLSISFILNSLKCKTEGKIFKNAEGGGRLSAHIRGRVASLPSPGAVYLLALWGLVLAHVLPAGAGGYARFFFPVLPFLYAAGAWGLHGVSAQTSGRP